MRDRFDLINPRKVTTFGTAEFMTAKQMRCKRPGNRPAPCERHGPFLGFYGEQTVHGLQIVSLFANEPGHMLTVAPTRSGKGRCHILPNMLTWTGSAIVLDVKGENYLETAGWRASELGQRVIRLAPFEPGGARWNPLDWIVALRGEPDAAAEMQDAVTLLVELLFTPPPGGGRDPFWQSTAKAVVRGIIMHVCTVETLGDPDGPEWLVQERTMAEVRRLLTLQGGVIKTEAGTVAGPFIKLVGEMIKSKSDWVNECANIIGTTQGSERQWVGVLTEAIDQLAVWSYDRIKAATQTSDFHFEDVRENTTIYICIPPDHISAYRAFLRVVVGCAMRELKTSYSGDRDEKPVLMVLDEFPLLHHMQPIEDSLAYIAGYGVKLWFFVQDIGQFQQHYPSTWRSFIANCGVRTFFGVSDYETAKLVSDMTGQSTVASETRGVNENRTEAEAFGKSQHSGWSGPHASSGDATSYTKTFSTSVGSSLSVTYVGRPLVMPDEVMRLHAFEQIIFIKGELPIRAWMLPYDANKMMASRLLPPPKPGALPPARPAKSQSAPGPVPEARAAEEIAF